MIKVLIVDDSPVARELISHILSSDPEIRVTGTARSGKEGIESIRCSKPDVLTMDINMPDMNGFEATRIIMETDPVPIVIVTGRPDAHELDMSFRAVDAGALTVVQKPHGIGHADYALNARDLITTVKLMSEIKVVKRSPRKAENKGLLRTEAWEGISFQFPDIKVVAIGASTGGPPVIEGILSKLPKSLSTPVLVVQHMAPGFVQGFAEWLGQKSGLAVSVASHNLIIRPGHVYVSPDGAQMKVDKDWRLLCTGDDPENGHRPSVSYLFRSAAEVFGKNAVGVLLTGMGKDGAEELKLMKEKGAITIAQDEGSSAIFGMPGAAINLNAARYILPPDAIAALLTDLLAPKAKEA